MLLPLIGFIASAFFATIVGFVVIGAHPKWKINLLNIILFICGAFCFALLTSLTYTKLFSSNGTLESPQAVLGWFASMVLSVVIGGILAVKLGRKMLNVKSTS